MYRHRGDPRAAQTTKLLALIVNLPAEEYSRTLQEYYSIVNDRADLVAATWSSFTGLMLTWLRWEDECRGRRSQCSIDLPEEAKQVGVAAYYSSSIKRLIILASEDLAVDWMLPGWLLWYSNRIGKPLAPKLRKLEPPELLARIVLFPILVRGLRGIARALVSVYEYGGSDYAHTTALFVYWDIIATLHEAAEAALTPLKKLFTKPLGRVEATLYDYARNAAVRSKKGRVDVRSYAVRVAGELGNMLGKLLVEKRIEVEVDRF